MGIEVLGGILKTMYESCPEDKRVLNVHLFAIRYGKKIRDNNYNLDKIRELADLDTSYKKTLEEGLNLSSFVELVNR